MQPNQLGRWHDLGREYGNPEPDDEGRDRTDRGVHLGGRSTHAVRWHPNELRRRARVAEALHQSLRQMPSSAPDHADGPFGLSLERVWVTALTIPMPRNMTHVIIT